ncbi:hypothetical protein BDB00DRAFT_874283 [Zychaea mexicana]|uniref:uncharacterized protein n=1 Tax=Zychaea mexicana TaxID=64656 RepID=UPI0022FDD100|nr:uncharacterized protein BDB00DRAFT_874283 [Zychaea mexicana]KAI9491549.1 hypothetical protein BDB00DRAFT_874283 [Zychaea mexicana]
MTCLLTSTNESMCLALAVEAAQQQSQTILNETTNYAAAPTIQAHPQEQLMHQLYAQQQQHTMPEYLRPLKHVKDLAVVVATGANKDLDVTTIKM